MKKLFVFTMINMCSLLTLNAQKWNIQLQLEQKISNTSFSISTFTPENKNKHVYGRNFSMVVNYKLKKVLYGGIYVSNQKSTYNFEKYFIKNNTKIEDGKININRFITGLNVAVYPTKLISVQLSGGLTFISSTIERGVSKSWYVGNEVDLSGKKLNVHKSPFIRFGGQYHIPLHKRLEGHIGYYQFLDFEDELIEGTSLDAEPRSILQIGLNILL